MGINVILFDLYGTLILTHDHNTAWDAWHNMLLDSVESMGGHRKSAESHLNEFWSGDDPGPDAGTTIFEKRIEAFFQLLSLDYEGGSLRTVADGLCAVWQESLDIDPLTLDVLGALRNQYRVGLVTNFDHPPHVRKILDELDIARYMDIIVISADEGLKKPDPAILLLACERMGCDPERTVYVGDSIVDYEAAVGSGIVPIIIRRKDQKEIENSRDKRFRDADDFLYRQANEGTLTMVSGLNEVAAAVEKI